MTEFAPHTIDIKPVTLPTKGTIAPPSPLIFYPDSAGAVYMPPTPKAGDGRPPGLPPFPDVAEQQPQGSGAGEQLLYHLTPVEQEQPTGILVPALLGITTAIINTATEADFAITAPPTRDQEQLAVVRADLAGMMEQPKAPIQPPAPIPNV